MNAMQWHYFYFVVWFLCSLFVQIKQNRTEGRRFCGMQQEFCPTPPSTNNSIPVINALDEGNYSMAREQIDDIQTGDSWFNIRNELESRQATCLVSRFNYSMLELERLTKTEDSLSFPAKQAKILSENLDDIANKLSEPAVNIQRFDHLSCRNSDWFWPIHNPQSQKKV